MRRAIDLLLGTAAAILLSPVMLLTAGAVAVRLGRPLIFAQARAGRGGKPFVMVKFRTMTDARDASGQPLDDEARLVPLGRLLRRTRLDELPGLLNVIAGDLSLIGPRPLLPETVAQMGEAGARRGAIRPGLTGWAQVNGNARLSGADKLALDIWYISHRSLRLDLLILMRTIGVILFGERARDAEIARAYAGNACRRG